MTLDKLLMCLRPATLAEMYLDVTGIIEESDYTYRAAEITRLNAVADVIVEAGEANCGVSEFWQIVKELSE